MTSPDDLPSGPTALLPAVTGSNAGIGSALDVLASKYGTDKASTHHNYVAIYEKYFEAISSSTRGLLEIGVGGVNYRGVAGSSLRMWADYFPQAQVVGIDIDPSAAGEYGERVHVVIGDQTRRSVLNRAISLLPSIDIIIDDGAHMNVLTIATFEYLFPKLRPGGIYVIEDTVCTGELRLGNTRTQMENFLLELLRGLETNGRILTKKNTADFYKISDDYVLNSYERWVDSISLHRGLYFVRKRAC